VRTPKAAAALREGGALVTVTTGHVLGGTEEFFADVQTSSIDTVRWRDGLAGHRAIGRGPMQTSAFEAPMQTCPSWWRRAA